MEMEMDEPRRAYIAQRIINIIRIRKFGPKEPETSLRMIKIEQNVHLMTLELFNERLTGTEIEEFIEEYSSQFVSEGKSV